MPSTSIIQALTDRLQTHKESQFTGIVHVGVGKTAQWSLYFHMGRMVWAHSRTHPTRRWYRQIVKHCPHVLDGFEQNYAELHYTKLVAKVREGNLNRIHMAKAVEDYLSEILFDIIHQGTLRDLQSKRGLMLTDVAKRYASNMFLIVRAEQAWQQTLYDWQAWQQAELVKCSPNLAPKIGDADALKQRTSPAVYEHLINIIDGEQSFRDLAVQLNQPLLPLTRRIVPYVRQGLMGLVRVEDLTSERETNTTDSQTNSHSVSSSRTDSRTAKGRDNQQTAVASPLRTSDSQARATPSEHRPNISSRPESYTEATDTALARARSGAKKKVSSGRLLSTQQTKVASNAPLIIYIDDSPLDSRAMGDILQDAGFRFRSIQESTHALPLLIEHKPQLIFLDLVMPVANGYEICSQVRRVSLFRDIPIVIVTSNNSLADRVHAKMVGATGFLSKPINRDKVLRTVQKLIEPKVTGSKTTGTKSGGATKLSPSASDSSAPKASSTSNIEKARRLRAAKEDQARASTRSKVPSARA